MNKFTDLYYGLDGVVIDVEQGDGFDDVCLETIKRVKKELADLAESCTTALTDEQIIEIRDQHIPSQGERFDCLAFARSIERAILSRSIAAQTIVAASIAPSSGDVRATTRPQPVILTENGVPELWLCVHDKRGMVSPIAGPMKLPQNWRAAIAATKDQQP